MATSFRTLRKFMGPKWLVDDDDESTLIGYSLDLLKDAFLERLELGHLASYPQQDPQGTPGPSDALAALGRDRRCVRGLFETETEWAARMIRARIDDRKRQGNPWMLLQKLAEYLGPLPSFRTVDDRGNWFSRAAGSAGGTESVLLKQENWDWSGDPVGERWSRFWVIIYPNALWSENPDDWGANTWGADGWGESEETWGSTATPVQVATTRALVADWMPAGTRCVNIIIALDPASFDPATPEPDGLWEQWSKNVGGVQVPARLSTARYWDGVTR